MGIKRHKRKLANGEERTYIYEVDGEDRRSLGVVDGSVSPKCYRAEEKNRILAALQADSSLLVIGESGCGKSTLADFAAEELSALGFVVAVARPATTKQMFVKVAEQLGVDAETFEGKALTVQGLQESITEFLSENTAFLICDDAHRFQVQIRCWLERLQEEGQPLLLLANHPPARDIFLKLPRIELQPLSDRQIREIMREAATELGLELPNTQLAQLQQRCGGNPMLAHRVIREEYLGLDEPAPDHTQFIDGTPLLLVGLMAFTIVRFIGLGMNNTTLYLIGGMAAVTAGMFRVLVFSLPKKSARLGR